jgi:hypothetical protein
MDMRRRRILAGAAAIPLLACPSDSCDNATGPSPPVPPPPDDDDDDIPVDDYMRVETEVDFHQVVGITAFSLMTADEGAMRSFIEKVLAAGYNTLRVGSETADWSWKEIPSYLPQGPPIESRESRENLKRFLKVTATYPNLWVQLISSFTIKEGPMSRQKNWARYVAGKVKGYKHIFLSAMNEPHQSGISKGEIIELLKILKASGRPVGVDYQAEGGHWRYPREVMRYTDYVDVHPRRNPDLSLEEIQHVVRLNGLTLFSETTSYASEQDIRRWPRLGNHSNIYLDGHGSEKDRQRAAKQYMNKFKQVRRARWFFHSIAGIRYGSSWSGDFWIPKWR